MPRRNSKRPRHAVRRARSAPRLESLDSRLAPATFVVSNTLDDGPGSLRRAILDANQLPGGDLIEFRIGGEGVKSIRPLSPLPALTGRTWLQGLPSRRPGYYQPVVEISGALAGPGADGLVIRGDDCIVEGLAINGFSGSGIVIESDGNQVFNNHIGIDAAGAAALGNGGHGVVLRGGASNNQIGDFGRNVISANGRHGVLLDGPGTSSNVIEDTYIGTNAAGAVALGNGWSGVAITGGANSNQVERNVISGNGQWGVSLEGDTTSGNVIAGNYVGTDREGAAVVGNGWWGIAVNAPDNQIGGSRLAGLGNLVSGNRQGGITVLGRASVGNRVQGNLVGTTAGGAAALGNAFSGVLVGDWGVSGEAPSRTLVGGGAAGLGNVVSGNGEWGVWVSGAGTSGTVVAGNLVGTTADGAAALGNAFSGVYIAGASSTQVGTDGDGFGDEAERNVIAASGHQGVAVDGPTARNNSVAGNYIGTNAAGAAALGNAWNGVAITGGASNNRVGTNGDGQGDAAERNLISGNGQHGVLVNHPGTSGNVVAGNYVGTNAGGTAALGNAWSGIAVIGGPTNTRIGTDGNGVNDASERNVVASSGHQGVALDGAGTSGNVVAGNYIGTNAAGSAALGNAWNGVAITGGASNNRVGTNGDGQSDAAERNTVAGNGQSGVLIQHLGTTGNLVAGNYIGTDATGTAALFNAHGVTIMDAGGNRVGTNGDGVGDAAERNVISGNNSVGVFLIRTGPSQNLIAGNAIGLTPAGTALGNAWGVYTINASNNAVGGAAALANTIAFNRTAGVVVQSGTGNSIRANSIYSNAGLGIDLGAAGVTANDPGDPDAGANNLQNYPVLTAARPGATTRVTGTLNSTAGATFTIDAYASPSADPTGFGEGQHHLGSFTVTTDAAGNASFNKFLAAATAEGEMITLTATDAAGNTSEFSAALATLAVNDPPVLDPIGDRTIAEGRLFTITATATDLDVPLQNITFTLLNAPLGASISPSGGVITWTPAEDQGPGTFTFTVRVTDNGVSSLSDEETITVSVRELSPMASLSSFRELGNLFTNLRIGGSRFVLGRAMNDLYTPDRQTVVESYQNELAVVRRTAGLTVAMPLGTLPGLPSYLQPNTNPYSISSDGSVVVGSSVNHLGKAVAFRWTQFEGMVELPMPHPALVSEATVASNDGTTVVGAYRDHQFRLRPFVWTLYGGVQDLPTLPSVDVLPVSVSGDGLTIAGLAYDQSGTRAVQWKNGVLLEGPRVGLFGESVSGQPTLSSDGNTVYGLHTSPPGAYIWDETHGVWDLQAVFASDYGLQDSIAGWQLETAREIEVREDGLLITGRGTNPAGEAKTWRAFLAIGEQQVTPGLDRWWATAGEDAITSTWTVHAEETGAYLFRVGLDVAPLSSWPRSEWTLSPEASVSVNGRPAVPLRQAGVGVASADLGELPAGDHQIKISGLRVPDRALVQPVEFRLRQGPLGATTNELDALFVADWSEHYREAGARQFRVADEGSVIDIPVDELIDRFAPIVHFHAGERYAAPLDVAAPQPGNPYGANLPIFSMDALQGPQGGAGNADHLPLAAWGAGGSGYHVTNSAPAIYASVLQKSTTDPSVLPDSPEDEVAIDYWFFYPRSDWSETRYGGQNTHEGDWEGVTVFLKRAGSVWVPDRVAFGQHVKAPLDLDVGDGGDVVDWSQLYRTDSRPHVFAGLGGHASYAIPNITPWLNGNLEYHSGNGDVFAATAPQVQYLPRAASSAASDWLRFPGRWGVYDLDGDGDPVFSPPGDNGPKGPVFQSLAVGVVTGESGLREVEHGTRWNDPWAWSEGFAPKTRAVLGDLDPLVEARVPNRSGDGGFGDGNGDGVPDNEQWWVASFPSRLPDGGNGPYVTLAPSGPPDDPGARKLAFVSVEAGPKPALLVDSLKPYSLPVGRIGFTVVGADAFPDPVAIDVFLPATTRPVTFMTPVNGEPHWSPFDFDPGTGTGATAAQNVLTLRLADGLRGDVSARAGEVAVAGMPVARPALVQSLVNGDSSAQRSMVRSLRLVFEGRVDLALGVTSHSSSAITGGGDFAMALTRRQGGPDFVVHVNHSLNGLGHSVLELTFSGGSGDTRVISGSLADGNYTLRLNGGVSGAQDRVEFHRLFGDSDGDRDVDNADFGRLRLALLGGPAVYPTYAYFDFDGDGDVDAADRAEFDRRRGTVLQP